MGSEADEIFSSFQLSDDNKKKLNVAKEKFDGYFIPKRNDIFERVKFNKRRQNEGESVDHFITALHTLSEHCGYGDMRDQLIRDLIVVGIRDDKLSEKMQLDPDLTLDKAISLARQSEAVKKQQPLIRGQIEPVTKINSSQRFNGKQLQDNNRFRSNTAVNATDVEDHRPIIGITVQQGMQLVTSVRKKDIMRPYINPEALSEKSRSMVF
jgi:hypothetical protein